MAQIMSGIAMAVFVLTCAAVGLRLLWLAVRDGGGPALWCGLGFTFIALLGYPLPVIAGVGNGPVSDVNIPVALIGSWASAAGMSCFLVFIQRVFRAGVGWAKGTAAMGVVGLFVVTMAGSIGLATAPPGMDSFLATWTSGLWLQMLCLGCFGWMGAEGIIQWRMSKRRVALGLGDPVLSNRFLMWGVFGISTTLMVSVLFVLHLNTISSATSLPGQVTMAVFGVASSIAATLAFFPPKRFVDRIARAGAQAS